MGLQRLVPIYITWMIPARPVFLDAETVHQGDLVLEAETFPQLKFVPKFGKSVTVPETRHIYVEPLPASASAIA
jgi:hypothetical protein